ncbi:MAG: hypothetical protein COA79_18740 [Planctomycetota bacterium]|nr:MAG: hypothetical protein COA79_18740 [Planctomycetota bacterium]
MKKTTTHYSPSEYHNHLMANLKQEMAFNGKDADKWKRSLQKKLKQLMGYDYGKKRVPLKVKSLWMQEHALGTIEKIVFTSELYSEVCAYICIPKKAKPPYTFMVCLQGHSTGMHNSIGVDINDETKKIKVEGDRDFGLGCMRNGVAAICIEQRSFGERKEKKQKAVSNHGCHDAVMHSLMLGKTLCAERVYDVDRAIDYLYTRKDVDRKMIGVMGNSGGGTISLFASAILPRIRFAMPSCYFNSFKDSIMSLYHCGDNYIPGLLNYAEMSDIMGLFAPKPVVIVAGEKDPIFPVKATRKAFKDLKKIYQHHGVANQCHLVIGKGGHRFYEKLAWPKMVKLIKSLKNT